MRAVAGVGPAAGVDAGMDMETEDGVAAAAAEEPLNRKRRRVTAVRQPAHPTQPGTSARTAAAYARTPTLPGASAGAGAGVGEAVPRSRTPFSSERAVAMRSQRSTPGGAAAPALPDDLGCMTIQVRVAECRAVGVVGKCHAGIYTRSSQHQVACALPESLDRMTIQVWVTECRAMGMASQSRCEQV